MGDHPVEKRRVADVGVKSQSREKQNKWARPGGNNIVIKHGASMERGAIPVNPIPLNHRIDSGVQNHE